MKITQKMLHEASFYEKLPENKVKCTLCPHNCIISEGKSGICKVRKNSNGILYSLNYECGYAFTDGGSKINLRIGGSKEYFEKPYFLPIFGASLDLGDGNNYFQINVNRAIHYSSSDITNMHTSYGIGGPAAAYITPKDRYDLGEILKFANLSFV